MNLVMLVNREEIAEVLKRIYADKNKEVIDKAIEQTQENFDKVIIKNDGKVLLILEDDGFTLTSSFPNMPVSASVALVNEFRKAKYGKEKPLELVDVKDVLNPFSPTMIKKAIEALAEAIIDKDCLNK